MLFVLLLCRIRVTENLSSQVDEHFGEDEEITVGEVIHKAPLQRQIASFIALEGKTYHAYWDRYMGLLEACLRYAYENWQVVNLFNEGRVT